MVLTILRNIQYLGRQGLAFRGNAEEGNFDQIMQLSAKIDPRVLKWLEKKRNKYVHGDYQNEIIRIVALFYSVTSLKTSTKVLITPSWQMK